ncbi:MAG: heavy-metal-associated domain-containing protein [Bacteroidales bacterium]|nr:heavy-metal-associated domain-containing protein [Bacteroidales bacterium]
MKKTITMLAMMLMVSIMAMAKDIKTVVYTTTPQMHCDNCEKKIKGNLRFEKGVKKITTSVEDQTVAVEYDADKTSPEKIQKGFEKFGYKARQLKKDEKVKKEAHSSCENM